MRLADINLDALIYLLLGLIWLIAQIVSVVGKSRRRREREAALEAAGGEQAGAGARGPARPARAPEPDLREMLQTLFSPKNPATESPSRRPVPAQAPGPAPETVAAALRPAPFPTPAVRTADRSEGAPHSGLSGLGAAGFRSAAGAPSSLRAIAFPRMPMPVALSMRQDGGSRSSAAVVRKLRRGNSGAPALREAVIFKMLLDPPRALTPPGGGSWWDPRRG